MCRGLDLAGLPGRDKGDPIGADLALRAIRLRRAFEKALLDQLRDGLRVGRVVLVADGRADLVNAEGDLAVIEAVEGVQEGVEDRPRPEARTAPRHAPGDSAWHHVEVAAVIGLLRTLGHF